MDGSKARRTRNLRYKRPALASLGYHAIRSELWDIREACADIHWFTDQDNDTLLNALDGNEDEVWEFKMAFADLEAKADSLEEVIGELYGWDGDMERTFNDCTVALIGNRYRTIGFDSEEEDYFALTAYEEGVAQTEAGKRLMRRTKADMIATIGQCLGILLAFFDLRQQYDYLKATFDILRDENTSLLQTIKLMDVILPVTELDRANAIFERILYQMPPEPERKPAKELQQGREVFQPERQAPEKERQPQEKAKQAQPRERQASRKEKAVSGPVRGRQGQVKLQRSESQQPAKQGRQEAPVGQRQEDTPKKGSRSERDSPVIKISSSIPRESGTARGTSERPSIEARLQAYRAQSRKPSAPAKVKAKTKSQAKAR